MRTSAQEDFRSIRHAESQLHQMQHCLALHKDLMLYVAAQDLLKTATAATKVRAIIHMFLPAKLGPTSPPVALTRNAMLMTDKLEAELAQQYPTEFKKRDAAELLQEKFDAAIPFYRAGSKAGVVVEVRNRERGVVKSKQALLDRIAASSAAQVDGVSSFYLALQHYRTAEPEQRLLAAVKAFALIPTQVLTAVDRAERVSQIRLLEGQLAARDIAQTPVSELRAHCGEGWSARIVDSTDLMEIDRPLNKGQALLITGDAPTIVVTARNHSGKGAVVVLHGWINAQSRRRFEATLQSVRLESFDQLDAFLILPQRVERNSVAHRLTSQSLLQTCINRQVADRLQVQERSKTSASADEQGVVVTVGPTLGEPWLCAVDGEIRTTLAAPPILARTPGLTNLSG